MLRCRSARLEEQPEEDEERDDDREQREQAQNGREALRRPAGTPSHPGPAATAPGQARPRLLRLRGRRLVLEEVEVEVVFARVHRPGIYRDDRSEKGLSRSGSNSGTCPKRQNHTTSFSAATGRSGRSAPEAWATSGS